MSIKYGSKEFEKDFGPLRIADVLLIGREDLELTQIKMAEKLNISKQRLCDFEKGRRLPSAKSVAAWAEVFEDSPGLWLQLLLSDQLRRDGLDYKVSVRPKD